MRISPNGSSSILSRRRADAISAPVICSDPRSNKASILAMSVTGSCRRGPSILCDPLRRFVAPFGVFVLRVRPESPHAATGHTGLLREDVGRLFRPLEGLLGDSDGLCFLEHLIGWLRSD